VSVAGRDDHGCDLELRNRVRVRRVQPVTVADLGGAVLGPIGRLADALVDPQRRDRTAIQLLTAYIAVWTLYGVLSKGAQDIHFDMGEAVAWSREPALGYNHPPLSAWLVKAWFTIFPLADWAYYLLAITVAGLGLWIAWVLSERWLDGEKRAAGLALLTLVPFFNFHALRYNANSVLIPLWAATTLWFLRSFETRELASAALTGVAAACAMLGKYWSIVLIMGLVVAAVSDSRRTTYFRSPAPWVTIAVGSLALSPHIAWAVTHGFSPVGFALNKYPAGTLLNAAIGALHFVAGGAAYVGAPVVLAATATFPSRAAVIDALWPGTPHRRIVAVAFWAPLAVAILIGLLAQVLISSLWTMSAFTLLPVVLLSSPLIVLQRGALVRLLTLAVAVPILATLAAPVIAFVTHRNGVPNHGTHYRLVAAAIDQAWRATTAQPLRLVGSDTNLVNGAAFYLSDQPSTLNVLLPWQTPWVDETRIAKQGMALVCATQDTACMRAIDALASRLPRGKRNEVEIARTYLGSLGKTERYLIITIPPKSL
jgi:4-amino-4-deoxy-L-arabinose transferase-like glycosyltransferase